MTARWRIRGLLLALAKRLMRHTAWRSIVILFIAFSAAHTALAQVWGRVDERGVGATPIPTRG